MIPYSTLARLGVRVRDYTILDLGFDDPEELHENWKLCVRDCRMWAFNTSDKCYEFGHRSRQSCMAPGKGHFCFYTHLSGRWMCSVLDGASTYLDGHITRSVGRNPELRVRENTLGDVKFIEHSTPLAWQGRYSTQAHSLKVGAEALRWSFDILYRFVNQTGPIPSQSDVQRAAQIFVIHLAEAARFDSLYLDIIDKHFLEPGHEVGEGAIEAARHWSGSCRDAMEALNEKKPACKATIEKAKRIFEDVRLLYRPNSGHGFFKLDKMPIQLGPDGPIFPNEDEDANAGGPAGNNGGGAAVRRRRRSRGRDQGPQDQNTFQDPGFLAEHFLPFEPGPQDGDVRPAIIESNAGLAHLFAADWLTAAENKKTEPQKTLQIQDIMYETGADMSSLNAASELGQNTMDKDHIIGFSVDPPCSVEKDVTREQCEKLVDVLDEPECVTQPWFVGEWVVGLLQSGSQQPDVACETENKDNVSANVAGTAAQNEALDGKASGASEIQNYTRFQIRDCAYGETEVILAKEEIIAKGTKTEGSSEAATLMTAEDTRAPASLSQNINTMLALSKAQNPLAVTDQSFKIPAIVVVRGPRTEAEEESGAADVPSKTRDKSSVRVQSHDNLTVATHPRVVESY